MTMTTKLDKIKAILNNPLLTYMGIARLFYESQGHYTKRPDQYLRSRIQRGSITENEVNELYKFLVERIDHLKSQL